MSSMQDASRESMSFDIVIVGAGPAGLAAACRLGALARERGAEPSICVVEKGADVGSHIVSGAILDPRALGELFPDWRSRGAPLELEVGTDRVEWLVDARRSIVVPRALVPVPLRNDGGHVISLGELCRWLAGEAEALGINVLPGFAATEVLYDDRGRVVGIVTGDMGRRRDGEPKPTFQRGYELTAKYVIFAEGCRGHLGRELERRFRLREGRDPQHYGLGFKEVWEVDPQRHRPGEVVHTTGWPLPHGTDGGGFVYHGPRGRVSVGFVVSLGYRNPHLSPFEEFQRFKRHPAIEAVVRGGRRIAYGARVVNKGGIASLPRLAFPGGLLVGCEAGFLNGAKIKGTHTAMKSGMLAAEVVDEAVAAGDAGRTLETYEERIRASWLWSELRAARNFSAGFSRFGRIPGAALAFVEHNVLRGRAPWTLRDPVPDHARLVTAGAAPRIDYPRPDGTVSFDRISSVFLASTSHDEDQPCHLRLADPNVPIEQNLPRFDEPAQRYCPAGVYEVVRAPDGSAAFRINAANCIHCKACEIKDPAQNIEWLPPEGGSGPNYSAM